jgi:four helix bundle protein
MPLPSSPPVAPTEPVFDHERLRVYGAAIEFVALAEQVIQRLPVGRAHLADQLHRASTSIPLNIAEGAGEYRRAEKARFYRMARRSATECASILDVLASLGCLDAALKWRARHDLMEIVAMLTTLVRNLAQIAEGKGMGEGKGKGERGAP